MKFKTVKEGQQAIIYDHMGCGKIVEGPYRTFLFRQRLKILQHYYASQYQYLQVTYNLGNVEHIPGPCEMFQNPLEHTSVQVKEAVKIDANHMVVVYKTLPSNNVERRIVQGPTLFIPQAEEWLHKFCWHGEDHQQTGHMIPDLCKFQQVATIPAQFYYNVRDVRTTDDIMLTVKLMIFYELTDVIKMLETTHDPIADMINAVCADIIAFAGKVNFQQFLAQTNELSELSTFSQLKYRTERIGYKVSKVVYRGYNASDQLQAMQDSAIQSRTELRLNAELQEQRQKLTDFKLQKQQERSNLIQDMEKKKVEHRQRIEKMENTHQGELRETELTAQLECDRATHEARRVCEKSAAEQQVEYLRSLHGLDTDITKYLVNTGPGKVDQELQVIPRKPAANQNIPRKIATIQNTDV